LSLVSLSIIKPQRSKHEIANSIRVRLVGAL
jgi:hypothetical protein